MDDLSHFYFVVNRLAREDLTSYRCSCPDLDWSLLFFCRDMGFWKFRIWEMETNPSIADEGHDVQVFDMVSISIRTATGYSLML